MSTDLKSVLIQEPIYKLYYNHKLYYNYIHARPFTRLKLTSLAALFQKCHPRRVGASIRLKIRQEGREGRGQALTPTLQIHRQALTIALFPLAVRKVIFKTGNGEIFFFKSKTIDRMFKPIQRLGKLGYRLNLKCSGSFQISPYAERPSLFFMPLKHSPSYLSI